MYNNIICCNNYILVSLLLTEFTKGMILPKKDNVKENISNITSGFNVKVRHLKLKKDKTMINNLLFSFKMQMNATVTPTNNNKAVGCKVSTTTIKQQVKFQCRAEEFYNVFSSTEVIICPSIIIDRT